jgi:hypothetical protein
MATARRNNSRRFIASPARNSSDPLIVAPRNRPV